MKHVLLLRLAGPMQSWGTQSRFSVRDTGLEPSKSGVIGLLCAALGRKRHNGISDLARLRMAVRVDREGVIKRDYHTALDVAKADGKIPPERKHPKFTVTSNRYYLADADFLVGLEGNSTDLELMEHAHLRLANPVWPLYLGRKAFVPSRPVQIPDGVREGALEEVLRTYPWHARSHAELAHPPEKLRLVIETPFGEGPDIRNDKPINFAERTFTIRHTRTTFVDVTEQMVRRDPPCTSPV